MPSYILAWITLLSEWELVKSTKPCQLAQTTIPNFFNKSHEGFVLSKCQENGLMDQEG